MVPGDAVAAESVGELFHVSGDAVVLVDDALHVVAWSPGAASLFGIPREQALAEGATPLGEQLAALLTLPPDGSAVRMPLPPYGVLEVRHRRIDPHHLLLLRDVGEEVRRSEGLRALSRLSRGLLRAETPRVSDVLHTVAAEARHMTGAAYSAVKVVRQGTQELSHVVYDAPPGHFDERRPFSGLLSVVLRERVPLRFADLAQHPEAKRDADAVPLGPLCVVPLIAAGEVLGLLATASPPGGRPFDQLDEELLVDLAAHTAVAVRWAQTGEREAARIRLRSEIIRTARHDIRTPLATGKGYTRLLLGSRDRMQPDQVQTALEGLAQAFDRIEHMTEQLLLDEKLEIAGADPEWTRLDLAPLLDSIRRDAAAMSGAPDGIVVEVAPGTPERLAGDAQMVREVLDNLVSNALKYGGDVGSITLRAEPAGDRVRVSVRDQGPGIDEADQAILFERWTRAAGTERHGFGLGLSIVKRLVAAHGGEVGVCSARGEGATFWVTLPVEPPD